MGTAHFLVFEPFPYLELALVALAEIPEGANTNTLDPAPTNTSGLPHPFARKFCSLKFFNL